MHITHIPAGFIIKFKWLVGGFLSAFCKVNKWDANEFKTSIYDFIL